jgi:hypothetical protein
MKVEEKIKALAQFGAFLGQFGENDNRSDELAELNELHYDTMAAALRKAEQHNGWFTEAALRYAMTSWSNALTEEKLEKWLSPYKMDTIVVKGQQKQIGVIMAGNIPVVGLHDLITVVVAGHRLKAKLSSDDRILLPEMVTVLSSINPQLVKGIEFTDGQLKEVDAIIATGSNNSARYFEHYFSSYPHIIRKNRSGVAVLTGEESEAELQALGNDIFRYFGLGCRNVSKLFVPGGYDLNHFFKGIFSFSDAVINHNKYANNYDYHRAIYLLNKDDILENGFVLLKEEEALSSPVAVLHYSYYESPEHLRKQLDGLEDEVQCVVGSSDLYPGALPFGTSQQPELWDYADGVDTLAFLLKLHQG